MVERRADARPVPAQEGDGEQPGAVIRTPGRFQASTIPRISWGAVIAGAAVAMVAQLWFTLLGLAIGLTVIEPLSGETPWEGIGIGAGIWWIVTGIISLFLGGWTAGRMSGMPVRLDAMLHGIIAWAVVTFVTLYLVISGTGNIVGGALNVVEDGLQIIGGGAEALIPEGEVGTVDPDEAANITQEATDAVATSAWLGSFTMLGGLIAVAVGSALGAPKDLPASSNIRRE